jgi:hypothetical protein
MKYVYNINEFSYDKSSNTLVASENKLFTYNHQECFSNGRGQFFISNTKTNNFRRFRLQQETNTYHIFTSEDNIKCKVIKHIDITPKFISALDLYNMN